MSALLADENERRLLLETVQARLRVGGFKWGEIVTIVPDGSGAPSDMEAQTKRAQERYRTKGKRLVLPDGSPRSGNGRLPMTLATQQMAIDARKRLEKAGRSHRKARASR
jgi:hypothetical protein